MPSMSIQHERSLQLFRIANFRQFSSNGMSIFCEEM